MGDKISMPLSKCPLFMAESEKGMALFGEIAAFFPPKTHRNGIENADHREHPNAL